MFPETIERDGVRLERFCIDRVDVFELYDLFVTDRDGVSDVFEYVPQEPYQTVNDARSQLADAAAEWEAAESAQWAVYSPDDALAGYTGLALEWDRRAGRIGVILARDHWGNRYAETCAHALTALAFDRLDLELVEIGHEEGNDRSKRFIKRFIDDVGGQYDGVLRNWTPLDHTIADHHRYTVAQDQYRVIRGTE